MIALAVAGDHPEAMLPCPLCAASVRGRNLGEHLAGKHPGQEPSLPARLRIDGDQLRVRRLLGARSVRLPAPVAAGAITARRSTSVMSAYTDDHPSLAETSEQRAGVYLDVGGLRIACPSSTGLRKHWTGFADAPKRRRAHATVAPPAFVALQYELAARGMLRVPG